MAYTKIALAGATGNLGPAVLAALLAAGYEVTVLSRSDSIPTDLTGVKVVKVDYTSHESLVAALTGHDVLISNIPNHEAQPAIIDACIDAGIKRFIPSEFGSDVFGNANVAALSMFQGKRITQDHLKQKSDSISWTIIVTSGFLDWGMEVGFFINFKGPMRMYNGGTAERSFTLLSDVGKAVISVLQHPEETKDRAVYVQSTVTSQRRLLELAKRKDPTLEPKIVEVDTKELLKESYEKMALGGLGVHEGAIAQIIVSLFDEDYGANFSKHNDNELLGVKELTEEQLAEVVGRYV